MAATSSMAARNKASLAFDGLLNPVIFRTNWTEAARTSSSVTGWTAGGGVEYALTDHWTAKAEYLHVDLGGGGRTFFLQATQPPGTATMTASFGSGVQFDLVRVGFNFKFGAAPVVAKY